MVVDKNEITPFQKSPWKTLCKNGILLKRPIFSKQNFQTNFSIKHYNSIISIQSRVLMLQKSLGYAINKFGRILQSSKKIVFFKKIKDYKI